MNKLIGISFIVGGLSLTTNVQAQSTVEKAGKSIEKGAKTVGNKTAETASKGKSKVTNSVYKGKEGPNGETIYIDEHNKYYWIDKKGHKNYIKEEDLKDKVDKKN